MDKRLKRLEQTINIPSPMVGGEVGGFQLKPEAFPDGFWTFAQWQLLISDAIEWAWDQLSTAVQDIINAAGAWIGTVIETIKNAGNVAWSLISVTAQNILDTIGNWTAMVTEFGKYTITNVADFAADTFLGLITNPITNFTSWITSFWGGKKGGGDFIQNLSIGNALIGNAAITEAKIEDLAVTTAKIANLAVDTAKIADLAVETAKIANAAIDHTKIGTAEIWSAHIKTGNIDTLHLADLAVTTGKCVELLGVRSAELPVLDLKEYSITDASGVGATLYSDIIKFSSFAEVKHNLEQCRGYFKVDNPSGNTITVTIQYSLNSGSGWNTYGTTSPTETDWTLKTFTNSITTGFNTPFWIRVGLYVKFEGIYAPTLYMKNFELNRRAFKGRRMDI